MKSMCNLFALILLGIGLAGCESKPENKVLPASAMYDANESASVAAFLDKVARPKAKKLEITFWIEESKVRPQGHGNLSLFVDGAELIRPVDNADGFQFSGSKGFKFVLNNGQWAAYAADGNAGDLPQMYFTKVVSIINEH